MTAKTRVLASIAAVCCLLAAFGLVKAQTPSASKIQRIPIPNSDFPISLGVWVPAGSDTLYLSGNVPPVANPSAPKGSVESYGGNTEAQTVATLQRIQQALQAQKLDVVRCSDDARLPGRGPKQGKQNGLLRLHGRLHKIFRHKRPTQQTSPQRPASSRPGCSRRPGRNRSNRRSLPLA